MSSTRSMLTIIIIITGLVSVVMISTVDAYDPDPLQDFCVAVNDSKADVGVFVNGRFCKDPKTVTSDDFFFSGLNKPGIITSPFGSKGTSVFVSDLPGLNTLGISRTRLDFAPYGSNPPHVHPRASEILYVEQGSLYVGFITSNPPNPNDKNKLYAKILGPGDVFCFPKGLVHFQYNIRDEPAIVYVSQSSQNPGAVSVSKAVFGSDPPVLPNLLAASFQLSETEVKYLQSLPWVGN